MACLFVYRILFILQHQFFNPFKILRVILHRQTPEYFQAVTLQLVAFHDYFDSVVLPLVLPIEQFGYV